MSGDDDKVLAGIMRQLLNQLDGYVDFGYRWECPFLTLDLTIPITEAELTVIVGAERAPDEVDQAAQELVDAGLAEWVPDEVDGVPS